MSKKLFNALAKALSDGRPIMHEDTDRYRQWAKDCKVVADVCSQFNDHFDYPYFMAACGIK